MLIEKTPAGKWTIGGGPGTAPAMLPDAVGEYDAERGGEPAALSPETAEKLREVLSRDYEDVPDWSGVMFLPATRELLTILADTADPEILPFIAEGLGLRTAEEKMEAISRAGAESSAYRDWWRSFSLDLLNREDFLDHHFGPVTRDRSGSYLYDDEKAVAYVEVSRKEGEEGRRDCLVSLTLLGNPEAVTDEEGNRQFEWCCFFDDELSAGEGRATILGGELRTIDPFGESSRLHRRYDISWKALLPEELSLVVRSLLEMMRSYPPEG